MLKEIALLGALASLYINQPNRANEVYSKTILNSTEYEIDFNSEVTFEPHTEKTLDAATPTYWSDNWIQIYGENQPTDIYYWVNQIDNEEEVLCTFFRVPHPGQPLWQCDLPDLSSDAIYGLQLFQKKSLAGEVFYIEQPNLSNQTIIIGNILPDDATANLTIGNGTISIVKLTWDKKMQTKGILGYARLIINDMTTIAANSSTGRAPDDPSQLVQMMLYNANYTNRLEFTSGYYTREWSPLGYQKDIPMLNREYQPYASYSTAGNTGLSLTPIETGVTLVGISFEALNSLFGYLVFPGLTLGMLLLAPIFLEIMFAIIKLVKKG